MRSIPCLLALAAAVIGGCAAKTPVTAWGYSSWISEDGVASEASFEQAREACLAQTGVRDPASVGPGSDQEREFLTCMDGERWCTEARGCE